MDSIGENTVATCEKQSNFVPVLRSGDWSDIGKRSYMEDAHICIPNLAEKFGHLPGKEIVSLYGVISAVVPEERDRSIEQESANAASVSMNDRVTTCSSFNGKLASSTMIL
nr:probable protein phosphatase 2C 27 [Tanacetum cinerariifolium]